LAHGVFGQPLSVRAVEHEPDDTRPAVCGDHRYPIGDDPGDLSWRSGASDRVDVGVVYAAMMIHPRRVVTPPGVAPLGAGSSGDRPQERRALCVVPGIVV